MKPIHIDRRSSGFGRGTGSLVLLSLAVLSGVTACSDFATDPESGITLTTDQDSYVLGDTAQVTLYNGYREEIVYSPYWCDLQLERWDTEEGAWEGLGRIAPGPCITIADAIRPGGAVSQGVHTKSASVPGPGRYRLLFSLWVGSPSQNLTVRSNPFEIGPSDEADSLVGGE